MVKSGGIFIYLGSSLTKELVGGADEHNLSYHLEYGNQRKEAIKQEVERGWT